MSKAIRRFLASNSGLRPFVFKVDTSLDDGLPSYILPVLNSSFLLSIDGGSYVSYSNVTRPVIPLQENTIHEIRVLGRNLNYTNNNSIHPELDKGKLIEITAFGNGNVIGINEFINCSNLVINSEDTPIMRDFIQGAFWGIKQISAEFLNYWDFSSTTSLNRLCYNMELPFQSDLNINAPSATDLALMLSGVSSDENRFTHNIIINALNATTCSQTLAGGRYGSGVKIVMNTPLNTTLHFGLGLPEPDTDLSGVNVTSVTSNDFWISGAMGTAMADKMLLAWDELETMQSGVNWHMRGTQITSVGKAAIDSMELKHGCTFSNYSVL